MDPCNNAPVQAGLIQLPELKEKNSLRELLLNRAKKHAKKVFLIDPEKNREYTYAEFLAAVNRISNLLFKLGIGKGDQVAVLMSNGPEYLLSLFAVMQLGAVACPINTHLKTAEISYILANSDSVALFSDNGHLEISAMALAGDNKVRYLLSWDDPPVNMKKNINRQTEPVKMLSLQRELQQQAAKLLPEIAASALAGDDVAIIIYTSGTTGKPKGAMLTHQNMIVDAHWITHWNRLKAGDRAMCVMPLFHVNGQIVTVITPLYHGGSIVIPEKFSVSNFFLLIIKYGVTYVGTVATMLSMLLNRVKPGDVVIPANRLRIVFCGSAPVPREVQIAFEKTFQVPVIEGYGMTETTCRSTFNPLPPLKALKLGANDGFRKIGSVGLPMGNEIRIVDPDDNQLGPNKVGEIVIRGANVMKGYYKDPLATEAAFKEGWFYSGDLGYFDGEGYLYVVDRKKDMIIRGGENIYPWEIEEVLLQHPALKDAGCIGIPDLLYGEEVVAFVVLKKNETIREEELISFCQHYLADFKCPKKIKILAKIPKGPSGKLLRNKLREQFGFSENSL